MARNRQNCHRTQFLKEIALDYEGGARFAVITLQGNGDDIAAPHSQPDRSETRSIQSRISAS